MKRLILLFAIIAVFNFCSYAMLRFACCGIAYNSPSDSSFNTPEERDAFLQEMDEYFCPWGCPEWEEPIEEEH